MRLIDRIVASSRTRMRRYQLGLYRPFGRKTALIPRVSGQEIELSLPKSEPQVHEHEFWKILIDDCYGLYSVRKPVRTVLDVGANVGLFGLAARHRFPQAAIHCYEPNLNLQTHLHANLSRFNIQVWPEAVGLESGRVYLKSEGNSLHTRVFEDHLGDVSVTPFRLAIERLGGAIDVLKLDCEGAEWKLFEARELWTQVRFLTMEYHLWAEPGLTIADLFNTLHKLGFRVRRHQPSLNGTFGLVWADSVLH